mmetsp:Transcript_22832/g.77230  ORF Transcript_22832/g.77230 Transcript_22832/m.77230 type:complete len:200 (-) Transcript_22832:343-942(-)
MKMHMGDSQDFGPGEAALDRSAGRGPECPGGSTFATSSPGGANPEASRGCAANGRVTAAHWPRDRGVFVTGPRECGLVWSPTAPPGLGGSWGARTGPRRCCDGCFAREHLVPERVERPPVLVLKIKAARHADGVARAELLEAAGPQPQQALALARPPKGLEAAQRVPQVPDQRSGDFEKIAQALRVAAAVAQFGLQRLR